MKGVLFVYLLAYGGSALALWRPFYGLLVYMCFAVLRPDHLWGWALPKDGSFSKIIGVALLVGWALHGFGNRDFGRSKPIVMLLAGYWLAIVASAVLADNQPVAWQYVVLHSKILLPVLVGMTLVETPAELRMLAWTLVGCLGFLAWEAHGMYFAGMQTEFRESGMLEMDNNSFCIAMATGAGLAIFLAFYELSVWMKCLAFALATLMIHVPMFGESRGGMLGVLTVGAVTFYLLPKRFGMMVVYAAGAVVVIRLAGPTVIDRFSTIFVASENLDASAASRLALWKDCWDVMLKNPLLGIGPDHWPLTAASYGWPVGKEAHSVWFNAGAELGFVGVGLLLSFYLVTITLAWKHLVRANANSQFQNLGRMVIAAICGFMVSASFVSLDALELPFYVALIAVGALKARAPDWALEQDSSVAPKYQFRLRTMPVVEHGMAHGK